MIFARQSTAIIVTVGPVLDADGVAVTDGVVGDFKISKNGGAPAALNGSATLTHRHTGHYSLSLTATDVNTVGTAEVVIDDTVNACPMKEIQVVEPATYDVLFADAAPGPASPTNITAGTITTATNVTTLNGIAANVITAASIANGAIDAATFAAGAIDAAALAADAGTEIATAVWASGTRELTASLDPTAAAIADAVWDEAQADHVGAGSFGLIASEIADILVDTAVIGADGAGLTALATQASVDDLPTNAELTTALAAADDAVLSAVGTVDTVVDAIKLQTDKFVFTVANQVDANTQYINDTEVTGDGGATPWGPA